MTTATLYHGTTSVFGSFSMDPPHRRDSGNLGRGVYLTGDPERAMIYAEANVELWGGVPTVLEVEADLGNVAVLDQDLMDHLRREAGITFPPEVWDHERSERLRWWFLDHGYDSVENSTLATEACVFDPARLRIVGQIPYVSSRDRLIRAYEEKLGKPWPGKRNPPPAFPLAGDVVSGLAVRGAVDNTGSLAASLGNWQELPGIREVPMALFAHGVHDLFYAAGDVQRARALAAQIGKSGWVSPLIVVVDDEGPYVLEGGHRLAALGLLGVRSFPAMVVRDHAVSRSLENPPLPLVVLDHQGRHFETGVPVTFRFVRNTAPSPYMGERFQQHIEPAGRYMTHVENPRLPVDPSGRMIFETGLVTFKSPLVLLGSTDDQVYGPNSWKARLAGRYQATGLELSKSILEDGYDGIVTVSSVRGEPYTSEIVDLGAVARRNPGPDERMRLLERQAAQGDSRARQRLRIEQCRTQGHELWPIPFGDDQRGWRRSCVRCGESVPSGAMRDASR